MRIEARLGARFSGRGGDHDEQRTADGMTENTQGTERRAKRLVREQIEIELRQGGQVWRGRTTGLNFNGLAARLKSPNWVPGSPALLPRLDDKVEIVFFSQALQIPPVTGKLLRVEGSWVPGYSCFVAVSFQDIPWSDAHLLKEYVEWKEGLPRQEPVPQREWYIQRVEGMYGPLMTEEVREGIRMNAFTGSDLIWLAISSNWVPLASAQPFAELFQQGGATAPVAAPGERPVAEPPAPVAKADEEEVEEAPHRRVWPWVLGTLAALLLVAVGVSFAFVDYPALWRNLAGSSPSPISAANPGSTAATKPSETAPTTSVQPEVVSVIVGGKKMFTFADNAGFDTAKLGVSPRASWVKGTLVSDFNFRRHVNALGGVFGYWESSAADNGGTCVESILDTGGKDGSGCWLIRYDVAKNGAQAGTWMRLMDFDASNFTFLAFDIKGADAFSPDMIVEIKASNGSRSGKYRLSGISRDWQRFKIPLTAFAGLGGPYALYELGFLFSYDVCIRSTKGGYYVDNISFE